MRPLAAPLTGAAAIGFSAASSILLTRSESNSDVVQSALRVGAAVSWVSFGSQLISLVLSISKKLSGVSMWLQLVSLSTATLAVSSILPKTSVVDLYQTGEADGKISQVSV